jgi:hypothetical protein
MPDSFEPKTETLPKAQQEIWPLLGPAPGLSFVLYYGGTAVALHLGHRISVDFDFFRTIMDRAEAKDYRDISAMLSAGISLERALGAFAKMYGKDTGLPLRAMGFFKDGDLPSLPNSDQDILQKARDRVSEIAEVAITRGSLAIAAPVSYQKRSQ